MATRPALVSGHQPIADEGNAFDDDDECLHSNKKVKANDGTSRVCESSPGGLGSGEGSPNSEERWKLSYKEKVMGALTVGREIEMEENTEELDSDSDSDSGDEEDPTCPTIRLSRREKARLRSPWRRTLIVKMLGKRMSFRFMERKLRELWSVAGQVYVTDIGNDFFLARFTSEEDYKRALCEGPWMFADHYLTIRKWVPNFDPNAEKITKTMVWVHISDLPIEYYDKEFLRGVANRIGKIIKIDAATSSASRGKYAKLSVEVDLTKPLVSKFRLRRRLWRVVYEGLHLVCFKCGCYGHKDEECPSREGAKNGTHDNPMSVPGTGVEARDPVRPEVYTDYGPWMLVQKQNRRRNPVNPKVPQRGQEVPPAGEGSRFTALRDLNQDKEDEGDKDKEHLVGGVGGKENKKPNMGVNEVAPLHSAGSSKQMKKSGKASSAGNQVAKNLPKAPTSNYKENTPSGSGLQQMNSAIAPKVDRAGGCAEAIQSLMDTGGSEAHPLPLLDPQDLRGNNQNSCNSVIPETDPGASPMDFNVPTVGLSDMDVETPLCHSS
ncbi:hypothetical protein Tsubulata_006664 [Turnera subulata]|uniref:CCHC-type domain-containing protein n=1 Tax=Turnera subulata TaxID=218843 RepID=A0A9Q0FL53_9ROSI|nr:hypothetical protein Tsubulata_006664 [Turnera subulata]